MADPAHGGNGVPPKAKPDEVTLEHAIIKYPSDYTFKIMGLAAEDFGDHATSLVENVVGPVSKVATRTSSQAKYQSVSVSVVLQSETQRRAVYQALWEDKRVLYYL